MKTIISVMIASLGRLIRCYHYPTILRVLVMACLTCVARLSEEISTLAHLGAGRKEFDREIPHGYGRTAKGFLREPHECLLAMRDMPFNLFSLHRVPRQQDVLLNRRGAHVYNWTLYFPWQLRDSLIAAPGLLALSFVFAASSSEAPPLGHGSTPPVSFSPDPTAPARTPEKRRLIVPGDVWQFR